MDLVSLGRMLLLFAVILALLGGLLMILGKVPFVGHLPGDILIKKGTTTFYAPLAASLIMSIVLTLLLNLFLRR